MVSVEKQIVAALCLPAFSLAYSKCDVKCKMKEQAKRRGPNQIVGAYGRFMCSMSQKTLGQGA